jgi:hypothetical protein
MDGLLVPDKYAQRLPFADPVDSPSPLKEASATKSACINGRRTAVTNDAGAPKIVYLRQQNSELGAASAIGDIYVETPLRIRLMPAPTY